MNSIAYYKQFAESYYTGLKKSEQMDKPIEEMEQQSWLDAPSILKGESP